MSNLSTAAWVVHDLGLAAGFGGQLFGKIAMNPAVRAISSKPERGLVVSRAWNGYNIVNAVALGISAITWFAGRATLTGKEVDRVSRQLVLAKDVLMGTTVALGAVNIVGGVIMGKENNGATPIEDGNTPAKESPKKVKALQGLFNSLGIVTMICEAGIIGLTAVLAMRSGRSAKWSFASRLLP